MRTKIHWAVLLFAIFFLSSNTLRSEPTDKPHFANLPAHIKNLCLSKGCLSLMACIAGGVTLAVLEGPDAVERIRGWINPNREKDNKGDKPHEPSTSTPPPKTVTPPIRPVEPPPPTLHRIDEGALKSVGRQIKTKLLSKEYKEKLFPEKLDSIIDAVIIEQKKQNRTQKQAENEITKRMQDWYDSIKKLDEKLAKPTIPVVPVDPPTKPVKPTKPKIHTLNKSDLGDIGNSIKGRLKSKEYKKRFVTERKRLVERLLSEQDEKNLTQEQAEERLESLLQSWYNRNKAADKKQGVADFP